MRNIFARLFRSKKENNLMHFNEPVHIDFESFKPAFASNKTQKNTQVNALGTFLVTITRDNMVPRAYTNRVSGVNYKNTHEGVNNGWISSVNMLYEDHENPIHFLLVKLHENGDVVGFTEGPNGELQESDMEYVMFSHGDTIFLDKNGKPLDEMNSPGPTPRQREFMERRREQQVERYFQQLIR